MTSGRQDLPAALAATRRRLVDPRDQALAAELATGTLRWLAALDHVIAHAAGRPAGQLDRPVKAILRLAVYQFLHLDRVPAHAVVHDAVEMARLAGAGRAAGFVNAVLRAVQRDRGRALPPAVTSGASRPAQLDYLAVTLSHPRWLVDRWLDRYGFDRVVAAARFNNRPAPMTLRVNTLLAERDQVVRALADAGVRVAPTRFAPCGLVVTEGQPLATSLAERGWFFVQDEGSQLVGAMASPRPGERVFDACAAPGGKTTAMAGMMGDRGLIVAADLRPRRLALLRRTVALAGASCVRVIRADVTRPLPFAGIFDLVVVDAPCSGLGTIRRDPEIRWRRQPADLPRFAATQRSLLDEAAAVVKPGGRLLYATCSSEPEENDEVLGGFRQRHTGFGPIEAGEVEPGPEVSGVLDQAGCLRTLPWAHELEWFFAAMLKKHKHL